MHGNIVSIFVLNDIVAIIQHALLGVNGKRRLVKVGADIARTQLYF